MVFFVKFFVKQKAPGLKESIEFLLINLIMMQK